MICQSHDPMKAAVHECTEAMLIAIKRKLKLYSRNGDSLKHIWAEKMLE